MTRGSPPTTSEKVNEATNPPHVHHNQPPVINHEPFGTSSSGGDSTLGDSTPAPPSSPSGTPPPPEDATLDEKQEQDGDREENEDNLEFPMDALSRLEEMLNRPRWVVPVLPKQELELLLDASIRYKKRGLDTDHEGMKRFFDNGLQVSFQRLMQDDAVKDWKLEIQDDSNFVRELRKLCAKSCASSYFKFREPHLEEVHMLRYIYLSAVKCLELCVLKLEDDCLPLLDILFFIFGPRNRYHNHNIHKSSESTADKDIKTDETIFAAQFQENYPKGWLVDLINQFGAFGGFQKLKEIGESDREWNCGLVCAFIRPFGQCAQFLLPRTIQKYLIPLCDVGIKCLKSVSDDDLKKESKDSFRENVGSELACNLCNIYSQLNEEGIRMELESIRLKMIVRILKVASFAGRMNALSEIHQIITYGQNEGHLMAKRDMAQFLLDQDLLALVLKDNLHQPQYVDRVVKIVTDLLREKTLGLREMDQLWAAQAGKHDVIQKNVHEMLTRLAWEFSPEQLEHLFGRFTESWKQAGQRERERLLNLIRQLAEDDKEGQMAERVLNLLWDLARDPQLPLDIMEMALDNHSKILENALSLRSDQTRLQWLRKCVHQVTGGEWVLPAMKQLQAISQMFPDVPATLYPSRRDTAYRQEVVAQLQNDFSLVAATSTSLKLYMDHMRAIQLPAGSVPTGFYADKRYSHTDQIEHRLRFLKFLLRDGNLWLCDTQAVEVWEQLVVKPIFAADRDQGFKFFARLLNHETEQDLDPDITKSFFENRVLHLDAAVLSPQGILCFDRFLKVVNAKEGKLMPIRRGHQVYLNDLDLLGSEYLWKIILQAGEEVSERAIDIFKQVYSHPSQEMYPKLPELHQTTIEHSMNRLRATYDTLQILGRDKDSLNRIREGAVKMTRVLRTLAAYVMAYDENFGEDRNRLPLYRDALGRSFMISIKPQFMGVTSTKQEEPYEIMVHGSMTIGELRKDLQARLGRPMQKLELFYQGSEFIDQMEDRRTFDEVGISDRATLVVKMADNTGASSPDSSAESSPADRSPQNEQMSGSEWEKYLPSTMLSQRQEAVIFLFQIADLGSRLEESGLKGTARHLLRIIPANLGMQKQLVAACLQPEGQSLDSLFFAQSPTQVLYYLELAHAMMLPAKPTNLTKRFQSAFFAAGALRLCLAMLGQNNFLHQADAETRQNANQWLLRLLKFSLNISGRLLVNRFQMSMTTEAVEMELLSSRAHSQVLDMILNCVPGAMDMMCKQACNGVSRQLLADPKCSVRYKPEPGHLEALMKIAWAAGSGNPALNQNSQVEEIHKAYSDQDLRVIATMEDLCHEALECLTLCLAVCPSAVEGYIMRQEHWKLFFVDIILSNSSVVRFHGMEQFHIAFRNLAVLAKPFVAYLVDLMLNVLRTRVDERPMSCREYFMLLQKLLEFSHQTLPRLPNVEVLLQAEMEWLKTSKEYTAKNLESFPRDALLEGHLRVTKELLNFLDPEKKLRFGSGIRDDTGTCFVKELLEDFLLPSSKMYSEEKEAVANMQRSSTVSADISGSAASTSSTSTIPRSVTTTYSPRRCVPVCGPRSTMAAYETIVTLCKGCVGNMELVVKTLTDMFYNDESNSVREWEYQPQVALRGASTFVGLKNGGATCYMNSVFQQLFTIDELREGILNADPNGVDIDDDDDDDTLTSFIGPLSLSDSSGGTDKTQMSRKEYDLGILRCMQLMFAHLLGSQLQFYVPKRFWKLFRFGNEPINLREQHDALEFFNLLLDSCDNALKGLGQEMVCKTVFGGVFVNQIVSKECSHRRDNDEEFTSVSVDVRNHNNLQESLLEYVKEDLLECDNAYHCESCNKKVSAVKRLCIKKLPPVLAIQLKRFEFDWEREQAIKFNDYFEFPRLLDMEPYTVQGVARRQGKDSDLGASLGNELDAEEWSTMKYRLKGVIIHSGQANGGHYWSYIYVRGSGDPGSGKWYKFEDGEVTEYELESEEDLRANCFGGEYQKETMMDPYMKRMQPRRQKRWYNAYVLLYEQIEATEKAVRKQLEEMTLSSRLRQMPSSLETIVRRKNTKFVHDRSQFTPEFFRFMKQLCLINSQPVQLKIHLKETEEEAKTLAVLSIQLFSKFLFTTGLHAKKTLRGPMQEWLEVYRLFFGIVPECRLWFANHVFFERSSRLTEYLVESTSMEVRSLFQKILVNLAQYSKNDSDEPIARKFSVPNQGCLSDFVIWSVWKLVCVCFADMGKNANQLFGFFLSYAVHLGVPEKEQLFRLGFPILFCDLCVDEFIEGKPIRNISPETGPCFKALLHLLRCCILDTRHMLPENVVSQPNPVMVARLMPMPEGLHEKVFGADYKFLRKLMDSGIVGSEEAKLFMLYACWENLEMSKAVINVLIWHISHTYSDTKAYVDLLENLLILRDHWHSERLNLAFKGDGREGKGGMLLIMQEDHGRCARRSYLLIKIMTNVFEKSDVAQSMLDQTPDLKKRWISAIKWLHQELERKQFAHYSFNQWNPSPSNEIGGSSCPLERTHSARIILGRAIELIRTYCTEAEINSEEGNSEDEDEFTATCQNSSATQNIPSDPPPPYSPSSSGIRHSQSASSELNNGKEEKSEGEARQKEMSQSQSQSEMKKEGLAGHFGPGIHPMQTEEDLSKLGEEQKVDSL